MIADLDLNQPVVVTYRGDMPDGTIRFDSLRAALHSVILDFAPEALSSAFICTRQGGLNIVEIRDLYRSVCQVTRSRGSDAFAEARHSSPIDA